MAFRVLRQASALPIARKKQNSDRQSKVTKESHVKKREIGTVESDNQFLTWRHQND